jgi:hypothetical protein
MIRMKSQPALSMPQFLNQIGTERFFSYRSSVQTIIWLQAKPGKTTKEFKKL